MTADQDDVDGDAADEAPAEAKVHKLAIDTGKLPVPEAEFYANTVRVIERRAVIAFAFGQLAPGTLNTLQAVVGVDIPMPSLAHITNIFAPGFRATVSRIPADTLDPFPEQLVTNASTVTANMLRILTNDFLSVIDLFEFVPQLDAPPGISPVLRLKCTSAVLKFFVDACDRFQSKGKDDA